MSVDSPTGSPSATRQKWSRTRWTPSGSPSPSLLEPCAMATMTGQKTLCTTFPHKLLFQDCIVLHFDVRFGVYSHSERWMASPVTGAVRIMPAVGRGVPETSTGVIETDSVSTQPPYIYIWNESCESVMMSCCQACTCAHQFWPPHNGGCWFISTGTLCGRISDWSPVNSSSHQESGIRKIAGWRIAGDVVVKHPRRTKSE